MKKELDAQRQNKCEHGISISCRRREEGLLQVLDKVRNLAVAFPLPEAAQMEVATSTCYSV